MTDHSKLLLITFYFPPYPGVGGRRWSKHLKYLNRTGADFRVLAGDFDGMESSWDKDIIGFSDRIDRIPVPYVKPYFKKGLPNNIVQKIFWKLSYFSNLLKHFLTSKDLTDVSIRYTKLFIHRSLTLIKEHKIEVVILSVGPYDYSKALVAIKKEFPHVKVCVDFRDPWKDTYEVLSKRKMRHALNLKNKLLSSVDVIITVNDELVEYYKDKCPSKTVVLLPHAFDPEDLREILSGENKTRNQLKMVYGGSLYKNTEPYLLVLNKLTQIVNESKPFNVDIYVLRSGYEEELKNENINVYRNYIDKNKLFNEISSANYSMLIRPDYSVNAMSSKFFELIALRKPILYFGLEGTVLRFLEDNNLGYHVNEQNISLIANRIINDELMIDDSYNIDKHTFEYGNRIILEKIINKQ